jgi:hypothetical protein
MGHVHENVQGAKYYWEYVKRFGKESSETWWKDFVIAVLLAVIPPGIRWDEVYALGVRCLGPRDTYFALRGPNVWSFPWVVSPTTACCF